MATPLEILLADLARIFSGAGGPQNVYWGVNLSGSTTNVSTGGTPSTSGSGSSSAPQPEEIPPGTYIDFEVIGDPSLLNIPQEWLHEPGIHRLPDGRLIAVVGIREDGGDRRFVIMDAIVLDARETIVADPIVIDLSDNAEMPVVVGDPIIIDLRNLNGDDAISGGAGFDILGGGDGNDTLAGGAGSDLLFGGSGTDTVSYAGSTSGITVNLSTGSGTSGDAAGDRLFDIENVVGSGFGDVINVGNASMAGFDVLDYYAKNHDVRDYAAAHGLGYAWAFEHWVANGRFEGRAGGWDGVSQAAGADWGSVFSVVKYLQANPDILAYKIAHNLSDQWVYEHWRDGGRHEGRAGALDVSGAAIDAGAGSDLVMGGLYSDYVTGNTGNDTISGYAGDDVLLGGAGRDSINGGDGRDQIFGGRDDDFLSGADGDDSVEGGDGNDQVYGNAGHDLLRGNAGNDHIDGGEGAGFDTLEGGEGQDNMMGWDGSDVLRGEWGDDTLYGGNGNDVLAGGQGRDVLTGGAGWDVFEFHAVRDGQGRTLGMPTKLDVIRDFEVGEWIKLDGTQEVSVARVQTLTWNGGYQYRTDTVITVDHQWQITLEGYGANLWWNAAAHTFIGY